MNKPPKLPIDHEGVTPPVIHSFEPDRFYRYTWPGQKEKRVKGSELAPLVKGADVSMLNLCDDSGQPLSFERGPRPKTNTELEAEAAATKAAETSPGPVDTDPSSDHEG